MAFVSFVDIDPPQDALFFASLTSSDRFLYSKIKKKGNAFSKHYIKGLTARSLLPQIAEAWNNLSSSEKTLWTEAGAYFDRNGYRAFVSENTVRLKLGLPILIVPSIYHLALFGHLSIQSPASEIKIGQYHPSSYYVHHKVAGSKNLYEPVFVQEALSLPFQIGLNYKSNLTPVGDTQIAKFYAVLLSSYQGVDRENIVEIDLSAVSDWNTALTEIANVQGYFIGYSVFFHIFGYTGDVYFDNIKMIHSAVNWARDKWCSNIRKTFSNQYYQIPAHWVALELPDGSWYDSEYVDFS